MLGASRVQYPPAMAVHSLAPSVVCKMLPREPRAVVGCHVTAI